MFPLASAWALRFEIEPAQTNQILDVLKSGKPNIGSYGGDAFYSGLLNAGGGLCRPRSGPLSSDAAGNKANWESFGGAETNRTDCLPRYLFQKYICGIQPTSGGFATADVRRNRWSHLGRAVPMSRHHHPLGKSARTNSSPFTCPPIRGRYFIPKLSPL